MNEQANDHWLWKLKHKLTKPGDSIGSTKNWKHF